VWFLRGAAVSVAAIGLAWASAASAAEAMLTGVPKVQVRVGDIVKENWTTTYSRRATFLEQVTLQLAASPSCVIVDGPVDPAQNEVVVTLVDENRIKRIVLPNVCDQYGLATSIYGVGESYIEADAIYELGGVNIGVGRKTIRRRYPVRIEWAGGIVPTRIVTATRTAFRKGFRRVIYDTDFDNYVNVCINKGLPIRARGGRLYCVWQRSPSSLITVRVT
jgi:hypothetical protein